MSKVPLGANFIRLSDARLQAESSRNMYSEQGLLALMCPLRGDVCHLLMVVSNCMPGSPHCHVALEISRSRSWARWCLSGRRGSRTVMVQNSRSATTAFMNSSVTRTELLAFWKKMDE